MNCTPKKGYKAITINEQAYAKLEAKAKALDKSVPETILFLCENHKEGEQA